MKGLLAQSVEQLTFNQLVRGSSPRQPTIVGARRPLSMRAFFLLKNRVNSLKKRIMSALFSNASHRTVTGAENSIRWKAEQMLSVIF